LAKILFVTQLTQNHQVKRSLFSFMPFELLHVIIELKCAHLTISAPKKIYNDEGESFELPEAMNPQIINGYNASLKSNPSLAFLMANRSVTCGATLISRSCLLTAAHCIYRCVST
jgi:hypothetical protein